MIRVATCLEIGEKSGKNYFDEQVWEIHEKLSRSGKSQGEMELFSNCFRKCFRKCWQRNIFCQRIKVINVTFWSQRKNSQRKVREIGNLKITASSMINQHHFLGCNEFNSSKLCNCIKRGFDKNDLAGFSPFLITPLPSSRIKNERK